ncbi:Hypothetical protein CINCED_3A009682 [Cinara cedri]|uniref:Endonuclease/exonuclease/phosphatase n=1 Tax=Cinara cedri TaxID=506608 RepID=A0A5E4M4E3_9HEMI|nr:Hypothetical protein CINCED_3A009682 [Cinara cedri]
MRGADGDSDHYLVKGKMKVKIKKVTRKKGILVDKYDTAKLNNVNTCERFKYQMSEKIRRIDAEIGKVKAVRKPWFNDMCEDALNWRKEARNQWLNDQHNIEKEIAKLLEEAEVNSRMNRTRQLYQKINSIRGGFRKHNKPIVLYGAEIWPLRKTEERRIAVFERKVFKKMYGAYFDVLTNEWRKLHNEELQSLFQRPDILKEIK